MSAAPVTQKEQKLALDEIQLSALLRLLGEVEAHFNMKDILPARP
jgi:hypothetical protein